MNGSVFLLLKQRQSFFDGEKATTLGRLSIQHDYSMVNTEKFYRAIAVDGCSVYE